MTLTTNAPAHVTSDPALPAPDGPLSTAIVDALASGVVDGSVLTDVVVGEADPYGRDLQLALYVCYELHYRGFADVSDEWEWQPDLLRLRAHMEAAFRTALDSDIGDVGSDSVVAEMDSLSIEPIDGDGPSYFLRDTATWDQMREYLALRSIYHLKEADPHAWAIPRLTGQAKASYVAVEFDEYGGGRGDRVHQQLFADLMVAAELNADYLGYLDAAPAQALATVNLMSMFGLHRSSRGATVGHLAATEITSSPGAQRLADALVRLEAPDACVGFYREHVEADAVHEQVLRTDVVGALVEADPSVEADVVFGIRAFNLVEDRLADLVMTRWAAGESAMLRPL
ncbi:iron-containing redox enzyme family protein [Williamsia maris]|uniref:Iron-containing redox enzyme n=1 Tax=Williamsia maris TaxID=72806 RepID=A0ABT1HDX6_9NOCA|nr:iron-containing redox enzyme family protein [Williamsia maris]MCP2175878.1 Iron-containing redox enzyme [Williamsia maris]